MQLLFQIRELTEHVLSLKFKQVAIFKVLGRFFLRSLYCEANLIFSFTSNRAGALALIKAFLLSSTV